MTVRATIMRGTVAKDAMMGNCVDESRSYILLVRRIERDDLRDTPGDETAVGLESGVIGPAGEVEAEYGLSPLRGDFLHVRPPSTLTGCCDTSQSF